MLKGIHAVRWHELQDACGPARDVPDLLSRAAWGDAPSSRDAIDRLKDHICELGFVVREATAPAIPFLVELAEAPHIQCRPEILDLLLSIARANQWSNAAAAMPSDRAGNYAEPLDWERACRSALHDAAPSLQKLASSLETEVAQPARKIIQLLKDPDDSGRQSHEHTPRKRTNPEMSQ
ncbi:hypothetical protein ACWCYY_05155 [Kitasatospora sp. NPDC001664]